MTLLIFWNVLGFLVKAGIVFFFFLSIKRKLDSVPMALAISCCFSYSLMVTIMLVLSLFRKLNRVGLLVGYLLLLLIYTLIITIKRCSPFKPFGFPENKISVFLLICMLILVGILTFHSLFFYDTTLDALTYGMPRLSLYAHNQSLFIAHNTSAVNIFSNEWLGELNQLYYLLISQTEQAALFGNVENILFLFVIFACFFWEYNIRSQYCYLGALLIVSTPVVIGLSMVVKGDMLACGMLVLCYVFYKKYVFTWKPIYFTSFFCALGLSAGSKIVLVPCCALLFILVIGISVQKKIFSLSNFSFIAGALFLFAVNCSRYLINLFIYLNPFQRVDAETEKMIFSVSNLSENLTEIFKNLIGYYLPSRTADIVNKELTWILSQNIGLLSIPLLIMVLFLLCMLVKNKKSNTFPNMYCISFHIISSASVLLIMLTTHWYSWSFRYYAPYIFLLFSVIYANAVVCLQRTTRQSLLSAINTVLVFICVVNAYSVMGISECRPTPYSVAYERNMLQRKLSLHPYIYESLENANMIQSINGPSAVLILNYPNTAISPYFGNHYQNEVQLVETQEELFQYWETGAYQMIVITYDASEQMDAFSLHEKYTKNTIKYNEVYIATIYMKEMASASSN